VALAAGCVALILTITALDLARGPWAITTLCLVFVPAVEETRARIRQRVLGTATGAVVATVIAVATPSSISVPLAAACGILTVAYALLPDDVLFLVFWTSTVLLLLGAARTGATLSLDGQRLAMTAVAGGLAMLLTALALRPAPVPGCATSDEPATG
jgi:uncharacterized membrane protein YccC